jgi:4-amino-4-deoxy-L-arabinose transferase-like glycosyltransferase
LRSAGGVGFAWAENDYLDHMDRIRQWAAQARQAGLPEAVRSLTAPFWEEARYWNPHPPLFKYLGLLGRAAMPGLPFPEAERLPSALLFAACATLIFWTLWRRRGWVAGLCGAAALCSMPRFFGYSAFCTPEMPQAFSWLAAALAHERYEQTRRKRWLLALALAFAFGLGSKLSAVAMLAPLAGLTAWHRFRAGPRELLRGAGSLLAVLAAGLLALVLLYPFLWPDPARRLLLLFSEARSWGANNPFLALFSGRLVPYTELPWYFGPVIIALVTPPLTLLLSLLGAAWPRERDPLWLWSVSLAAFWLLLVALPGTPKYDNERQLLSIFPFLALLAGLGAHDLAQRLAPLLRPRLAPLLLGAGVPLVLVLELLLAHPFPLSYFTPLAGGLPGATRLGFEPTTAMEVLSREVLDGFSAHLPQGAGLALFPAPYLANFLQRRGYLRPDLRITLEQGPFFLLVNRHSVLAGLGQTVKTKGRLLASYRKDEVPLAELWYLSP